MSLPSPLVVEEEHQEESLASLLLPGLTQTEHVQWGHGDGHPVMQQALLGHVWVNDLQRHDST